MLASAQPGTSFANLIATCSFFTPVSVYFQSQQGCPYFGTSLKFYGFLPLNNYHLLYRPIIHPKYIKLYKIIFCNSIPSFEVTFLNIVSVLSALC